MKSTECNFDIRELLLLGVLPYESGDSTLGQTVQIAITPTLLNTTYGARRRFNPVRRQCYFEDEISLKHFPPQNSYR